MGNGWSNFVCKSIEYVVEFQSDFDLKIAANAYINPLTATAMLDYAQKHGAKSIVLMGASSALAKMVIRLAQPNGIETLNIVRKDDHIVDLKNNYGANFVFNSESSSFWNELKDAI
jgi:NADPH:quinone reductase-like Zn-dependent oxidoreductase